MKENSEKSNKEKGYVYLVTSEGGDAENHVHKTKSTSQSSTAIEEKTQHQLNEIACAGNKARLKAQLFLSLDRQANKYVSQKTRLDKT